MIFEINRKAIWKTEEKCRGLGKVQEAQSTLNFVTDLDPIRRFYF